MDFSYRVGSSFLEDLLENVIGQITQARVYGEMTSELKHLDIDKEEVLAHLTSDLEVHAGALHLTGDDHLVDVARGAKDVELLSELLVPSKAVDEIHTIELNICDAHNCSLFELAKVSVVADLFELGSLYGGLAHFLWLRLFLVSLCLAFSRAGTLCRGLFDGGLLVSPLGCFIEFIVFLWCRRLSR